MPSLEHPNTYIAYAFTEKGGNLEPIPFNWQDPQHEEIVVKVIACGVCHGDENTRFARFPGTTFPIVPGHEIVGDVAAIPSIEKKWSLGQCVGAGWHGGHCKDCPRCNAGDFRTCEHATINGGQYLNLGVVHHGGYAEYVTLRTEAVVLILDGMDPAEAAPLMCAGVTTFDSLRHMSIKPPQVVAVQGIGGLGHLAIQFSRAMGFRTIALSSSASKAELAMQLGADLYFDGSKVDQGAELQRIGGASLIVCTAPDGNVIKGLVPGLAVNGELLVLAGVAGETGIPLAALIGKRASIRGWPAGTAADTEDCCKFAQAHGIKAMINKFPLRRAQEAYDYVASARFRAVIMP